MRLLLLLVGIAAIAPSVTYGQAYERPGRNPHGAISIPCENCHTNTSWKPIRGVPEFDHNRTSYPLRGMHVKVNCTQCHTSLVFTKASTRCSDCHADLHRGQFGSNCEQCHTVKGWELQAQQIRQHDNRFPLLGAHAALDCSECHTGQAVGQFAGLSTQCLSCHTSDFQKAANPDHKAAGFPSTCETCHTADSWFNTRFDHLKFTGYALTGMHATVACDLCHINNQYTNTPTLCYSCHAKDFQGTTNPNHVAGSFPTTCDTCHTTAGWVPASFDHSKTAFALTGAHTAVACSTCHTDNYAGTLPTNCYGCHVKDYNNTATMAGVPNHVNAGFAQDCTGCHTTVTWLNATFNHNATVFPLTGAHATVACSTCHTDNYKGTLPTNCYGCHTQDYNNTATIAGVPNHVTSSFPQDCTQCHTTSTWLNATFNHNATSFPLTGAHTTVACSTCHTDNYKGTLPTNCYGCHTQDYNGTGGIAGVPNHVTANFPQDCTLCHTTSTWLNSTFNHNTTSFPLTGAHTTVACSTCHTDNYAGTLPTNCYGCHTQDYNNTATIAGVPNHVNAGFAQDCTQCHTTTTWLNATFNHNATVFPLTGAHTTVACSTCHTDNYKGTLPTNCYGCHTQDYNNTATIAGVPNHVTANFPQDCTVCHSTSTWLNATFNHNTTSFPLTGAHTTVACATCHTDNYKGTLPTTCYGCHTPDYNGTATIAGVPNHVTLSYPQDCTICHTTSTWLNATFNHSTTPFPLTGAHVTVACNLCHIGGVFAGTPTDCYSCHKADYQGTTNPNHTAAGFPTTCATCHTTASWLGATFNHTWFPTNHGNANGVCATCHTNSNDYSVFQCTNCHTAGQTNPQHSGISGYVYNSVNCYQCHKNGGGG
jgi:hypothetical protein